jgi:hypothetical protein
MEALMASTVRRMGIIATVLLGAGAGLGCGGSSANHSPAATAVTVVADDVAAGLMEHHRHHHHGGVSLLIAMSLDTLGVSPEEQAAVEKIRTNLHAQMEPARAAEQSPSIACRPHPGEPTTSHPGGDVRRLGRSGGADGGLS